MHRQLFENLSKNVPFSQAWVISSVPRGGLQILQPSNVPDIWVKPYARQFHAQDAITWRAILAKGHHVCGEDCWPGGLTSSSFYRDFLSQLPLVRTVAVSLKSPIFEGYPGALHLYRSNEFGHFQEAEIEQFLQAAAQFDRLATESRASQLTPECASNPSWSRRPAGRLFIFDSNLKSVLDTPAPGSDDHLFQELQADARKRLANLPASTPVPEHLAIPDSRGELYHFNVVACPEYPGLGAGPFIFYCLEPDFCDWNVLRPSDVAADAEMSRLVPAIQFMRTEFARGPSLGEIAKTVHLSPFHFHRRFTELLGITPKRLLLECQIFHAKRLLASHQMDLVGIASACGFAHQSHFTSRFKQATGLTPTRWRKLAAVPA